MGGSQPQGFTIIEVMIFLAVSGLIFVSALTLMSGKQNRTEFSTGIDQLTSKLQSILGNVANGYYATGMQNFSCTANPSSNTKPTLSQAVVNDRGTNKGCIFLGEVLQFDPQINNPDGQYYISYPVVGNEFVVGATSPPPDVTTLAEAQPLAVAPAATGGSLDTYDSNVDESQKFLLPYGLTISSMCYFNDANHSSYDCTINPVNTCTTDPATITSRPITIGAIGIFTNLNGQNNPAGVTNLVQSNSQYVELIPISCSTLMQHTSGPSGLIAAIDSLTDSSGRPEVSGYLSEVNPPGGVDICFNSGTDSESGLITIGGVNSPDSVTLKRFSHQDCQ